MIPMHPKILKKDGEPEFVVLPYAEFLQIQAALARMTEESLKNTRFGEFYSNLSADELARRQGVAPVADLELLAWPFSAEDWEGFEEAVDAWRHGNPAD